MVWYMCSYVTFVLFIPGVFVYYYSYYYCLLLPIVVLISLLSLLFFNVKMGRYKTDNKMDTLQLLYYYINTS